MAVTKRNVRTSGVYLQDALTRATGGADATADVALGDMAKRHRQMTVPADANPTFPSGTYTVPAGIPDLGSVSDSAAGNGRKAITSAEADILRSAPNACFAGRPGTGGAAVDKIKLMTPTEAVEALPDATAAAAGKMTAAQASKVDGMVPEDQWVNRIPLVQGTTTGVTLPAVNTVWYPNNNVNATVGQGSLKYATQAQVLVSVSNPAATLFAYAVFSVDGGTTWLLENGGTTTTVAAAQGAGVTFACPNKYNNTHAFTVPQAFKDAGDALLAQLYMFDTTRTGPTSCAVYSAWIRTKPNTMLGGAPFADQIADAVNGSKVIMTGTERTALAKVTYGIINVLDPTLAGGADPTGTNDSSAAFAAAIQRAADAAAVSKSTLLTGGVRRGMSVIYIPPGEYKITTPEAFMGNETLNAGSVRYGIHFIGSGFGTTRVFFKPATAGKFINNKYWLYVQFSNINFIGDTTGCTFFWCRESGLAQQAFKFHQCWWTGWNKIVYLEGVNNCSEITFHDCHSRSLEDDGWWLFTPPTDIDADGVLHETGEGSDQFYNYTWTGMCTMWSTAGGVAHMASGGRVFVTQMDVSNWCNGYVGDGTDATRKFLFEFLGTVHASGGCTAQISNLRVEAKAAHSSVFYSEWPAGVVRVDGADTTSQLFNGLEMLYFGIIKIPATGGASYLVADSFIAGKLRVEVPTNGVKYQRRIVMERVSWAPDTYSRPDQIVEYVHTANHTEAIDPSVWFRDCRFTSFVDATATDGASIGSAVVGDGSVGDERRERCIDLRYSFGLPTGSQVAKFNLPMHTLILGMKLIIAAGDTVETSDVGWTVQTREVTPTTICTIASGANASLGCNVTTDLSVPFRCSSDATCQLQVVASNVVNNCRRGRLLLRVIC